jgi:hypothetical protein
MLCFSRSPKIALILVGSSPKVALLRIIAAFQRQDVSAAIRRLRGRVGNECATTRVSDNDKGNSSRLFHILTSRRAFFA